MQSAFGFLAEVLSGVVGLIQQAMDPTSDLGESVAALGIQFESLFKTIFGQDATIGTVFEVAGVALGFFIDLMHDLIRIVQNTIIGFQVMGEQIGLLLSGKFQEFLNFDAAGEIRKRIDLRDTITNNQLAVRQYISEWDRARQLQLSGHIGAINLTADAWERANRAASLYTRPKGLPGSADAIERWLNVVAPKTKAVATSIAEITGSTGGGASTVAASAAKEALGLQGWIDEANKQASIASYEIALITAGLSKEVAKSILSGSDAIQKGDEALWRISTSPQAHINWFTTLFNNTEEGRALLQRQAEEIARETAEAAEKLRQQEQDTLDKRQKAYESFSDSVKSIFGGIKDSIMSSFSLPDLGNSVNSITRNIQKLLSRAKDFARNITSLSEQGLSGDLLQQVIAAGPMAGGRLAQALVGAGGGFIGQLNQAYGEFGSIASGIAGVGTQSAFSGQQTVNNYSIEVTGGLATGSDVGRAVVNAIKDYERQSGAAWRA
jgi:hypothetical protein